MGRDGLLSPGSWWRLQFARLFPATVPLQSVLAQLLAEHRRPQPDSPLLARALTLELLLHLCRAADTAPPAQLPAAVRAALPAGGVAAGIPLTPPAESKRLVRG